MTYLGVLLGMLLLGWSLLAIRPRLTLGSADALQTAPLASLGIGLAALIGQFVVIALLALVGVLLAIMLQKLAIAIAGFIAGGRFASALLAAFFVDYPHYRGITFVIGGILGALIYRAVLGVPEDDIERPVSGDPHAAVS